VACPVADKVVPSEEERSGLERVVWTGDDDLDALESVTVVIKSPGALPEHPLIQEARRRSIPIVAELELGWSAAKAPLHSITGSNGKSTTTSLLAHLFATAGIESVAAGNIGEALSAAAPSIGAGGAIAVEVSSFQIEDLHEYRSRSAALLNVSPDHLDRHGTLENYFAIKASLCRRLDEGGVCIMNADDPTQTDLIATARRQDPNHTWVFGMSPQEGPAAFLDGSRLVLRMDADETFADTRELTISGPHNVQNALAAALAATSGGVAARDLASGLRTFRPLRHRLERVGRVGDVTFVNDSKATNLDALKMALFSFPDGVVLIAGGRDKGSPFASMHETVKRFVRHLVLIGEASEMIRSAWPDVDATHAGSMTEAVRVAYDRSRPSGVVLLAPGCTSFDMFNDFVDRGDRFRDAVLELRGGCGDA